MTRLRFNTRSSWRLLQEVFVGADARAVLPARLFGRSRYTGTGCALLLSHPPRGARPHAVNHLGRESQAGVERGGHRLSGQE